MLLIWLQFIIGAGIIIIAGTKLCVYADAMSDRLQLSKAFIGVILLGVVTSLPEIVTSLTASIKLNAVDLALGNVLGSNNFNLIIIVILDFLYRQDSITNKARLSRSHIVSAAWSLALLMVVIVSIAVNHRISMARIGNFGIDSLLIAALYIVGIRFLSRFDKGVVTAAQAPEISAQKAIPLSRALIGFLIATIFVVVGGIWIAYTCEGIARLTGWGETFVGSIFLAIATSLPEVAVSIAALRIGSVDMSLGNIFGSNMINVVIISLNDAVYLGGALLSLASKNHLLTAFLGVWLTSIAMLGLSSQKKKAVYGLGYDTVLMLASFIVGNYVLFRFR